MLVTLTKDVPKAAVAAVAPMFNQVCRAKDLPLDPKAYDWAIHPGGASILRGAQKAMNLSDNHIRASLNIYQNFGNSSSPTVLVVLDQLRHMGRGKDNVIATSFGPGLLIEMFRMTRCRDANSERRMKSGIRLQAHRLWMLFASSLSRYNITDKLSRRDSLGTAKHMYTKHM